MVNRLLEWWNTSCQVCLKLRSLAKSFVVIVMDLIAVAVLTLSGLFIYWIFFDVDPILHYGNNSNVAFTKQAIIVKLDATRLRDCPVTIRRKITGCGQIDIPETIGVTAVGEKPPPVAIPLSLIFSTFSREDLSGNVCQLISIASGYCNPAQRMLNIPIITVSPPISFVLSTGLSQGD
jgi:hypothetical protein